MKILIFSDLHVHHHSGSSEKLDNCIDCLHWIYKESEKRRIKNIVFGGDLFHDRHKINLYAYNKVYEILEQYSEKINSYFLVGNHDMFYRSSWSVISLKPLSKILRIIDKPETIKISDLSIDFLPYTENPEEEMKKLSKKSKVLVSHLAVQGATLNTLWGIKKDDFEEEIDETNKNNFEGYERVFLGHYHARQRIKGTNIEYIGSPLQLSFGEAMDPKGFIILDTETMKTEFVENTFSPKYFIIPDKEDLDQYNINGGYLKLLVSDIRKTNLIELKRNIKDKYNLKSIEIIQVEKSKKETGEKEIKNIELIYSNKKSVIQKFVENTETDLDKNKLIEIGSRIISEVNQEVCFN
jgi:DNA repair exonuclease SbcCD nuclease subunit